MKKSRGLVAAAAAIVTLLAAGILVACGGEEDSAAATASASGDVVAVLSAEDQLSNYADVAGDAGLDGEGPYTVFAASDDGVAAAAATLDADAVKASVIEGEKYAEADLAAGVKSDSMLEDNTLVIYTGADGSLYVNDVKVIGGPLDADNGVVYIINGVILPE